MARCLVLGGFDVLHWGHVHFLAEASKLGEITVGLSSDELLRSTKREPLFTYKERAQALDTLGYDRILRRDSRDAFRLFQLGVDYYACGTDWIGTNHLTEMGVSQRMLDEAGTAVVYIPRPHSMSTTEIVGRVRRSL